jgi:phage-related protein
MSLPLDAQAEFQWIADRLIQAGPQGVGMPHVRPLGQKLWEIRFKGQAGAARAIYVATSGRRLNVLHVFPKKTQRTPERSRQLALRRMREIAP